MEKSDEMMENGHAVARVRGLPDVFDLGYVRDVPGHADRLLDFWVLAVVSRGGMTLQVGGAHCSVSTSDYYLLPAGVRHFGLDTSSFDAVFFHFALPSDADGDAFVFDLPVSGPTPVELDPVALHHVLERDYRHGALRRSDLGIQVAALLGLLAAGARQHAWKQPDGSHDLAFRVLELLRARYAERLGSDDIADAVGYSYSYLERVFRRRFGTTIHQQLVRLRMDAAAHALQMGKPIKEAAASVGMRDYHYFLKTFKRAKGMTPGEFQRLAARTRSARE
jgi:AraC-like DNA-binding protein